MAIEYKICSRCHIEKPKEDFRIKTERRRRAAPLFYLNNTCKVCDAEITRLSYKEWRKTPEGRKKNRERAKSYYEKWALIYPSQLLLKNLSLANIMGVALRDS